MLMLAPAGLLARRAVAARQPGFPPPAGPRRMARWLRHAWYAEGAAQWLSGQTAHVRPAVARRLREGSQPSFPPGRADALLLGGTVIDLLAREEGDRAARRAHREGPRRRARRRCAGPRRPPPPRPGARTSRARRGRRARADAPRRPPAPLAQLTSATTSPASTMPTITTASTIADPRTHGGVPWTVERGGGAGARRYAERLARDLGARGGHEDVARPAGEEVGDVEAAASGASATGRPPRAGSLEHLRLGLVAGGGDLDERRPRRTAADLARAIVQRAPLRRRLARSVDQRHAAVAAEALVEPACAAPQDGQTSGPSEPVRSRRSRGRAARTRRRRSPQRARRPRRGLTPTMT